MIEKISSFVGNLTEKSDQKENPTDNSSLEKILANAFKGEDPIAKLSEGVFDNLFAGLKEGLEKIFSMIGLQLDDLKKDVNANGVLRVVTDSGSNLAKEAKEKLRDLPE